MSLPLTLRRNCYWSLALAVCLGCASGAPNRLDAGQRLDAAERDPPPPAVDAGDESDAAMPPHTPRDAATRDAAGDGAAASPPEEDAGDEPPVRCDDGSLPGDCGCPGEPGAEREGTACDDGECPLSAECDGDGRCGSDADCAKPDPRCGVMLQHGGHYYYVCPTAKSWADARAACITTARFDLIRIDDEDEQSFLETSVSSLTNDAWINATDMSTPDSWAWMDDGTVFWMGDSTGTAVDGHFARWAADEPNGDGDCARHAVVDGVWRDTPCTETRFFVCEAAPP